jgi:hypothetical protein
MRKMSIIAVCGLLLFCLGTIGCNRNKPGATTSSVRSHGHSHGHGPNGGHIVELDTLEYHAEVTQDAEAHRVGVYLLDGGASAGVAVPVESTSVTIGVSEDDKPTEYQLPAVARPDDVAGKSSYFEVESEPLLAILSGAQELKSLPELKITIGGKSYTGVIEDEHAHDHFAAHSHNHVEDSDILIWLQASSVGGYEIALGHHGTALLAGSKVEPAVQVTRSGEPVADAKVFNSLLDADGNVVVEEVATVYEPPAGEEPAHYAQGTLTIPAGTREAKIRFRVVLPENAGEKTLDVPVTIR